MAGLFYDLSAAFDCIDINFVRPKLIALGFRGTLLECLMSFIELRKFMVKINSAMSHEFQFDKGVPQGSVLGPLLFILFINDLASFIKSGKIIIYVDDVSVIIAALTAELLKIKVATVCDEIKNWYKQNNMILNDQKTVSVYFNNGKISKKNYSINDNMPGSNDQKFLGLYVDNNISWDVHLDYVSKKINKAYFAILQLKSTLGVEGLLKVYYALVYPHLSYNVVLWGNATNWQKIFVAQKRILRLIFNLKQIETCKHIFKDNKIMTLPGIYLFKCLLIIKQNYSQLDKNCMFHTYETRYGDSISTKKHNTKMYEKSVLYAGSKFFNILPKPLKCINDYEKFKYNLKIFMLDKCFYNIDEYLTG